MRARAYAAHDPRSPLAPFDLDRREVGPLDVAIAVEFCGVCHSDLHQARDEWGGALFPMVPGHEIVGRVTEVGAKVKKVKAGDRVGVGCMVASCGRCKQCGGDHEQFCDLGVAWTYNSTEMDRVTPTFGGYSTHVVVTERFVLRVPESLDAASAAPLLCAGITTYSPLMQWGAKAGHNGRSRDLGTSVAPPETDGLLLGQEIGVVGLGGLGHMAVKLAASMGARVTLFSTSASKEADAARLGASRFVLSTDSTAMKKAHRKLDLIIDTVSAAHDYGAFLSLLKPFGTMVLVGVPPDSTPVAASALIMGNKRLVGSLIGGIAETQRMLDYCGEKGITADVEIIPVQKINEAYARMLKNDVKYRFVLDLATI